MRFLRKEARRLCDFNVVVSSIQMLGAATAKACLIQIYTFIMLAQIQFISENVTHLLGR